MPSYEVQPSKLSLLRWRAETGLLRGIKNPNLVYEPHNLLALIKSNHDLKVVLCLRDPVSWLHSFYEYRMKEISENAPWLRDRKPPESAIKQFSFSGLAHGEFEFLGVRRGAGFYVDYLRYYKEHIDKKNLFLVFLEDLAENPNKCYRSLYNFLEIRASPPNSPSVANSNSKKTSAQTKDFDFLSEFYKTKNEELWEFIKSEYGIHQRFW